MRSILCAIDLSDASVEAVRAAKEIAVQKKLNLVVIYAYRLLQTESKEIADYRKSIEKQAQNDFIEIAKAVSLNGEVPYEFRTEIGFFSDRIEAYLKSSLVDTLVINRGLADSMYETKEETIAHFNSTNKVAVLIIP